VKFCDALQDYFDVEFWFYEYLTPERPEWWRIDLGDRCKVFDHVLFDSTGFFPGRYLALDLVPRLERFDPDVVMVGGFSIPSNYLAYRWAKSHDKKAIVFTERSRNYKGELRKRSFIWRLLRYLFRDVDLVITSAEDALPQFRDEFGFGDKVVAGRYAADLEAYFGHFERTKKPAYTYLFANRMIDIYNPLGTLDIFSIIHRKYPGSRLLMNAVGELKDQVLCKISSLQIEGAVQFLTEIRSWNKLPQIYAQSDILLLPAFFSNGNFTILEAMASGMGVVISNRVLGIGKIIEDGKNGFNCEPTVEAFLDRIERYIDDPALFKTHAALNRLIAEPLSTKGTASFFANILKQNLGVRTY
jgi:glycosyltransferase involved in cell wall biosynthesis